MQLLNDSRIAVYWLVMLPKSEILSNDMPKERSRDRLGRKNSMFVDRHPFRFIGNVLRYFDPNFVPK